ncbi:hypothetical protein GA0115259_1020117 [Streptomyces sp. MnatMP-M17]|nr:hypothetical protein GA0115259_1020117 [Streptomyces sp. MnatMP-M17]
MLFPLVQSVPPSRGALWIRPVGDVPLADPGECGDPCRVFLGVGAAVPFVGAEGVDLAQDLGGLATGLGGLGRGRLDTGAEAAEARVGLALDIVVVRIVVVLEVHGLSGFHPAVVPDRVSGVGSGHASEYRDSSRSPLA